ncbi:hypothetical protein ACFPN2_35075 [Steroidobacter flavus]|uniref:Uncharacterized protein n=1 Tax=Steroidobacter flavus TaxID=1842136 RepID=A0ABV8T358_9GAMM
MTEHDAAADAFWFEEELVAGTAGDRLPPKAIDERGEAAKVTAIVRVDRPRWRLLEAPADALPLNGTARFILVRLGFQFDVPPQERGRGALFVFARCQANLLPLKEGHPVPVIYDLYPKDLYDGEPRQAKIALSPNIKIGTVEASLGTAEADIGLGMVAPVVVGWPGEDERAPYWDITPNDKKLLGTRHFWAVLEVPRECEGVRISAMAEAELQTRFGPIPLSPRTRASHQRPVQEITFQS